MSATDPGLERLLAHVDAAWSGSPARGFFAALAGAAPTTTNVAGFMARLPLYKTTVASRFHRLALPSPKSYLVAFRLYLAAEYIARPGMNLSAVAVGLRYSSPQSFGRHIRGVLGISGQEFRRRFTPTSCWARLNALLIQPYGAIWPHFDPLTNTKGVALDAAA